MRNTDGSPGAGAMVLLTRRSAAENGSPIAARAGVSRSSEPPRFQAQVGRDGTFQIAGVPAGNYNLSARGKGGGVAKGTVHVSAGETARVSLRLSAPQDEQRPASSGGAKDGGEASSPGRGEIHSRGWSGRAGNGSEGGRPLPRKDRPLPRRTPPNSRGG